MLIFFSRHLKSSVYFILVVHLNTDKPLTQELGSHMLLGLPTEITCHNLDFPGVGIQSSSST